MPTKVVASIGADATAFANAVNSSFEGLEAQARATSARLSPILKEAYSGAAKQGEAIFRASFDEINRLAANASRGGGLSIDIGAAKAATQAAQERLRSLEAITIAAERAARAERDHSEATRLYIQAGRAAIGETRAEIASLTQKEAALERIQQQLGGTVSGQAKVKQSQGQVAQGAQQLNFQLNDIASSFAAGISPMQIFAQQGSQVVQAIGLMKGSSSGLIGLLSGPWGAALTIAVSLLGTFALKHFESGDAATKNGEKQKSLTDSIKEQNEALRRNIELQTQRRENDFVSAQLDNSRAVDERTRILFEIAQQRAIVNDKFKGGSLGATARKRINDLEQELKTVNADVAKSRQNLRLAQIPILQRQNEAGRDPLVAAADDRDRAIAKINQQYVNFKISAEQYRVEEQKIQQVYEAQKKAIEARQKAETAAVLTRQKLAPVTSSEVRGILDGLGARITRGRSSPSENRAVRGAKNSYHLFDQAYDLGLLDKDGKPLTKARIRAALESNGVILKELLGPGDKDHDDHFHVAFSKRRGTPETIADAQIRRDRQAEKDAIKAAEDYAKSLLAVRAEFDPTAEAAARYQDVLKNIAKVEAGLSSEEGQAARIAAAQNYYDEVAKIETARHQSLIDNLSAEFQAAATTPLINPGDAIVKPILQDAQFEAGQKANDRDRRRIDDLSDYFTDAFSGGTDRIFDEFLFRGRQSAARVASEFAIRAVQSVGISTDSISQLLGTAGQSAAFGTTATRVLGVRGSNTGAAIGGTAGSFLGPQGQVIGSIIGSLVGGALKKTKKGVATLGFSAGELGLGAVAGNSGGRREAASGSITNLAQSLSLIAEQLGGSITSAGSVSLGVRGKKFTVDTTGSGRTKGTGVLSFSDEAAAMKAAFADALKDGVIGGISDAASTILKSAGTDLQRAIEKAVLIEAVPKALKARLDPVGAAIDEVNARYEKLVAALREGGASAQQMADAQRLYSLELAETKAQTRSASADLKDFLDSIAFGPDSKLSISQQKALAQQRLDPFLAQIDRGERVDQQAYIAAQQAVLDITRQSDASGPAYFAALARAQDYTGRAIAGIDGVTSLGAARDPFAAATASNTATANELLDQQTMLLASQAKSLSAIEASLASMAAGGGTAFIGSVRGFA